MRRRAKLACGVGVLAVHTTLLMLLFGGRVAPSPGVEASPPPIQVWLGPPPPRPPVVPPVPSENPVAQSADGGAPAAAPVVPAPPPPPSRIPVRPARPTTRVETVPVATGTAPDPAPPRAPASTVPALTVLGGGQLAGALRAGSGGGGSGGGSGGGDGPGAGGACDMVARLEAALRDDAEINAAVAAVPGAAGGAVLVWNGDWIQSPGQAGKGLATVRQAIALEVAFAPPACRSTPVRGLALIALDDRPNGPKVVLGRGAWRWSDLVSTRR